MPTQTHRTIIFEEFNVSGDNAPPNLFTIINNKLSSDSLVRSLGELTVHNFSDFMKKFAPKVYEVWGKNPETGHIEFFYTTDPTKFAGYPFNPIDISEHAYYKMLAQLYAAKGASGQANLKFNDNEVLEMLTPKKELGAIRNIRESLDYNLKLYYQAQARGDRGEMNTARAKITECRKKIAEYAKSSVGKLLPILIEDTNKKLEHLGIGGKTSGGSSAKPKALPKLGMLYLNAAGQLDVDTEAKPAAIEAPKNDTALVATGSAQITNLPANPAKVAAATIPDAQNRSTQIATYIMKDYDKASTNPNEQVKNLIVSTFAPLASASNSSDENLDAETLLASRNSFENAYRNARESFAAEMSRIIERLLGVKTFFDHATAEGGESANVPGGVIISNCKASRLLEIKDEFRSVINTLGSAQGSERIWFAVIPSVSNEKTAANFSVDAIDSPFDEDLDDTDENSDSDADRVSVESLKQILEIMDEAKITTVFNIRNAQNTFADLDTAEVTDEINRFRDCNFGHAVYAYPNFTLIRERNFSTSASNDVRPITLPGIFIDAAYPAAGLLVASQQVDVLRSRKLKVDKGSVCVRVDLENVDVKQALHTNFNRETVLRRSEDLIRAINENMFGFAFSGDEVHDNEGNVVKNSYVHCARTLARNRNTGNYKPIYQTLTEDFIAQEILLLRSRKPAEIEKHVNRISREFADKNKQNAYRDSVNLLFRENENVRFDSGGRVIIHFEGGDNYIEVAVESD